MKLLNNSITKVAFFYTGICYDYNGTINERPELKNNFNNNLDFIIRAIIGNPQVCINKQILIII